MGMSGSGNNYLEAWGKEQTIYRQVVLEQCILCPQKWQLTLCMYEKSLISRVAHCNTAEMNSY